MKKGATSINSLPGVKKKQPFEIRKMNLSLLNEFSNLVPNLNLPYKTYRPKFKTYDFT